MSGRGDGVARIAAPDSARLDFFLAGGFGTARQFSFGIRSTPGRRHGAPNHSAAYLAVGGARPRRVAESARHRHPD